MLKKEKKKKFILHLTIGKIKIKMECENTDERRPSLGAETFPSTRILDVCFHAYTYVCVHVMVSPMSKYLKFYYRVGKEI